MMTMNPWFFIETLKLAITNLYLHKLRSFLTTLGIIIGVLAVVTMLAIGEGAKRRTRKDVEQLGATNVILRSVPPPGSSQSTAKSSFELRYGITRDDFDAVRSQILSGVLDHIELAVPLRDVGQEVTRGEVRAEAAAIATIPSFLTVANLTVGEGRFINQLDMDDRRPVCVLGYSARQQLFGSANALGQPVRIGAKIFEVIGVMGGVGMAGGKGAALTGRDLNKDIYFPMTTGRDMFSDTIVRRTSGSRERKVIELSEVYIRVNSSDQVEPVAASLRRMMDLRHTDQADVEIFVPRELLNQANKTQRLFNFVLGGIALLSLLIGGIGIMNISLATVTERTREIGIRRALGAKRLHIILQFLIETTALSVIGGLLGVAGGILLPKLITLATSGEFPTYVTLISVAVSFSISAGVGIAAGLYPAIVAAHKDPIEALRHD